MGPNIWTPESFYVQHVASGELRRVCAVRNNIDGTRVFQFFHVIKHNGDTISHAGSGEVTW